MSSQTSPPPPPRDYNKGHVSARKRQEEKQKRDKLSKELKQMYEDDPDSLDQFRYTGKNSLLGGKKGILTDFQMNRIKKGLDLTGGFKTKSIERLEGLLESSRESNFGFGTGSNSEPEHDEIVFGEGEGEGEGGVSEGNGDPPAAAEQTGGANNVKPDPDSSKSQAKIDVKKDAPDVDENSQAVTSLEGFNELVGQSDFLPLSTTSIPSLPSNTDTSSSEEEETKGYRPDDADKHIEHKPRAHSTRQFKENAQKGYQKTTGHHRPISEDVEDNRATGSAPDPDWGGKTTGPLKKEDLAYQMCHPRMCFRFFQKGNYESLMKLMTFSTKNGKMFPNEDGREEAGPVASALSSSRQIVENYGRTLQVQKLLYDPEKDPQVDPMMVLREYLELHEATRVALTAYQSATLGDFHQPDGFQQGIDQFNSDANESFSGFKHTKSSGSEGSAQANNKWAPKLKRTKLQHSRAPQRLHEFTYKWM